MRRCYFELIMLVLTAISLFCCSNDNKELWKYDPKGAESIYESSITPEIEGFEVVEEKDDDGSRCVRINKHSFPQSLHYRLYSPNGNLRIIASGSVLQGGVDGYRIDYDTKGRVCKVIDIDEMDNDELTVQIMKKWLHESQCKYPEGQDTTFICRDDNGEIISIGCVEVPYGYQARMYIKEWGPFWESDIDGGFLGFFVSVEYKGNADGSHVNYLYYNDRLIAELAYWKGVFIKARTYNKKGAMVNMYTDRSIDVAEQAFEDYNEVPIWYVDN